MKHWLLLSLDLFFMLPANADELGRLFFSPEQRRVLELTQSKQIVTSVPVSAASAPLAPKQSVHLPANITVNGVIQRSDGNRVVWINGQAQSMIAARDGNPASVTLPNQNQHIELKVGQRWRPKATQ